MEVFYNTDVIDPQSVEQIISRIKTEDGQPHRVSNFADQNSLANEIANIPGNTKSLRKMSEQLLNLYQNLGPENYPVTVISVKGKIAEQIISRYGFTQAYAIN